MIQQMLSQRPVLVIDSPPLPLLTPALLYSDTKQFLLVQHPFFQTGGTEPAIDEVIVGIWSMSFGPGRPSIVGGREECSVPDVGEEGDGFGSLKEVEESGVSGRGGEGGDDGFGKQGGI
jgi:hypothetical protein